MMISFKGFRKKQRGHGEPQPMRIEGIRTRLTPKPDDAETAAQALLESLTQESGKTRKERMDKENANKDKSTSMEQRDTAYYRRLADRIRESREADRRLLQRNLVYFEEQLGKNPACSIQEQSDIERMLYGSQDFADREGGELLRRWQHCLAEVTVRQMSEAASEPGSGDSPDGSD